MYTRLDIALIVDVVGQFQSNLGNEHWTAVKYILRYLEGTSRVCLYFGINKHMFDGYTDTGIVGEVDSRNSTSRYLFFFQESYLMAV